MIKGNKGEWSEYYAFLKLLVDRKLFAADKNLELIKDKFYLVHKIIRGETKHEKNGSTINTTRKHHLQKRSMPD